MSDLEPVVPCPNDPDPVLPTLPMYAISAIVIPSSTHNGSATAETLDTSAATVSISCSTPSYVTVSPPGKQPLSLKGNYYQFAFALSGMPVSNTSIQATFYNKSGAVVGTSEVYQL